MERKRGNFKEISDELGLVAYATVLQTNKKPVFLSPGYAMSIDAAFKIALKTSFHFSQPEPLQLAHNYSKKEMKMEMKRLKKNK